MGRFSRSDGSRGTAGELTQVSLAKLLLVSLSLCLSISIFLSLSSCKYPPFLFIYLVSSLRRGVRDLLFFFSQERTAAARNAAESRSPSGNVDRFHRFARSFVFPRKKRKWRKEKKSRNEGKRRMKNSLPAVETSRATIIRTTRVASRRGRARRQVKTRPPPDTTAVNISCHVESERSPSPFSHSCPKFHASSLMSHRRMTRRLCPFAINESLRKSKRVVISAQTNPTHRRQSRTPL